MEGEEVEIMPQHPADAHSSISSGSNHLPQEEEGA
jgi:hypothetical protein